MIKNILLFLLFAGITLPALSQTEDELKALAIAQARITSDATVAKDYKTVLNYTLPAVLELMGGKDAALQSINSAMAGMEENGFKVVKSEVVKMVGFAFEQDQYRCVIENNILVRMNQESSVESTSYIIGMYDQGAGQWHFIEAGEFKNKALMEQVLPGFETQLNIPDDIRKVIPN